MAKSLRAKTKQANRRKKRNDEGSYYAAVEAARVQKVSDRLLGKDGAKKEEEGGEVEMEGEEEEAAAEEAPKISTSGPRENRRDAWRASKGMAPRQKGSQNRQLKAAGKSKAGRPKRRR